MEVVNYRSFVNRLFKKEGAISPLLHAAVGIAGESGEVLDLMKKHVAYNKPLDSAKLLTECGDILFYIEAAWQALEDAGKSAPSGVAVFTPTPDEGLTLASLAFLRAAEILDAAMADNVDAIVYDLLMIEALVSTLCLVAGSSKDECIQGNIAKLMKRYPAGEYSDAAAIARADVAEPASA